MSLQEIEILKFNNCDMSVSHKKNKDSLLYF